VFGKKFKIFDLLGFKVSVDVSWILIAILIAWFMSMELFPNRIAGLSGGTYWLMGILGAAAFFGSIVFHELCHSLVARHFGIPMKGITLFIFGGVAEMDREPPTAKAEFYMAAAGPASSLFLSLAFHVLALSMVPLWPAAGTVLRYLSSINLLLAGFNLIFAFPLDGGRILRAALWGWSGNLKMATRVSSQIGSAFGSFLVFLGVFRVIVTGSLAAGLWPALIGIFLRSAARGGYQNLLMRRALEGEVVGRFMNPDPVTVQASLSLEDLVNQYVYRYHHKFYPITDNGQLTGCVSTREIKEVPKENWPQKTVGEIARQCGRAATVSVHTDAMEALSLMKRTGESRLMVTEGSRLLGIVSLKDLLSFLSLRIELEEG